MLSHCNRCNSPTSPIWANCVHCEVDSVASCVNFHSDWMARAPNKMVAEEASTRRERFPVAAVVVVHDDIALMRTTLEEVAAVVEHIVSAGRIA